MEVNETTLYFVMGERNYIEGYIALAWNADQRVVVGARHQYNHGCMEEVLG